MYVTNSSLDCISSVVELQELCWISTELWGGLEFLLAAANAEVTIDGNSMPAGHTR